MLQTHHWSRPISLIYDVIALCPSGYVRLLFLHFRFAPSDKSAFCHSLLSPLDPAPHLLLVTTCSIAWSVHVSLYYINPMPSPSKLQSSLLGYFPGYTRLSLVIPMRPVVTFPHLLTALTWLDHWRSLNSWLYHLNLTTHHHWPPVAPLTLIFIGEQTID